MLQWIAEEMIVEKDLNLVTNEGWAETLGRGWAEAWSSGWAARAEGAAEGLAKGN